MISFINYCNRITITSNFKLLTLYIVCKHTYPVRSILFLQRDLLIALTADVAMVSTGNGENLPFGVGVGDVGVGLVGLILDLSLLMLMF